MATPGNDLPTLRSLGGDLSSIVRHSGQGALPPRAAEFLRQSLASSLRVAFLFVLVSTVAAVIAGLFVPGGQAHELAHSDQWLAVELLHTILLLVKSPLLNSKNGWQKHKTEMALLIGRPVA